MSTATLSSKSQIVLPAEVRRRLGLRPGDRLVIEVEDDHVVVRKAPASDVDALAELRSELWRGYARDLEQARNEWDR
ncbi:MAG: AbrB/MazE/SpoVT family DNA-binding domain-containing protein [Gammaproteobacteria bacterium]|nr:AbrB/MazE/SpoVT family DNA-binding domain-containing protein [Gammaproteobacteria bacterium]